MKGVNWSSIRKILQLLQRALALLCMVCRDRYSVLYTITIAMTAKKAPPFRCSARYLTASLGAFYGWTRA